MRFPSQILENYFTLSFLAERIKCRAEFISDEYNAYETKFERNLRTSKNKLK